MEYLRKVWFHVDVAAKTEQEAREFLLQTLARPAGLRFGEVTLLYPHWVNRSWRPRQMVKVPGLGHNAYTPGIAPAGKEQVFRAFGMWGFTTDDIDWQTMPVLWTLRGKHKDLWHFGGHGEMRADSPEVFKEVERDNMADELFVVGVKEIWVRPTYVLAKGEDDAITQVRDGKGVSDDDRFEYSHTLAYQAQGIPNWTVEEVQELDDIELWTGIIEEADEVEGKEASDG